MDVGEKIMLASIVAITAAWTAIGWAAAAGSGTLAIATLTLASAAGLTVPLLIWRIVGLSKRISELERP